MWKTALAAAAVGIATLVGVIVFGRPLVEPEASSDPSPAPISLRPWGERASERCDDAKATVLAELATPPGLATPAERAVQLYRVTTEIEGRLLSLLRALPASAGELAQVDEALDLLEQQYERDVETTEQLERAYDSTLLQRELRIYERLATRLRTLFGALEADGCVSYMDPASYG
jgi:hypothetical protein